MLVFLSFLALLRNFWISQKLRNKFYHSVVTCLRNTLPVGCYVRLGNVKSYVTRVRANLAGPVFVAGFAAGLGANQTPCGRLEVPPSQPVKP